MIPAWRARAACSRAQAISLDTINVESEGTNGFVATNSGASTKTNTPTLETPQTINVVTRDQLNVQKTQSVPKALHYTPGVVTDRNGADQRIGYFFMRGFAADQYLNGMRLLGGSGGYATPQIDPYFLDRIEVM